MSFNIQIPQINPLKFYYQSDVLNTSAYTGAAYRTMNPNQNDPGFDNDFFYRNIKSWMDQVTYFQPWQQGDKIELQWLGVEDYAFGPTVAYDVSIVDSLGQTVKQVDSTEGAEVGAGSGIFIRTATLYLYDVPPGKYFVQIHKVGLPPEYDYFFPSEPIEIKAYHPNTILIKYKHRKNAYGIFWETGIEMWVRVEAAFTKLQPDSTFTLYDDDTFNSTLLSGVRYRLWQLSIGVDSKPVPMYRIDQLEEVFLCSSLYIEHDYFTRVADSKFELVFVDKSPLVTANINLREATNEADLIVSNYPPIVLGPAPTAEWFSVGSISQTTPATSYSVANYFNGAKNFVDYLNVTNFAGVIDYENTYFAIDALNNIVLNTNVESVYDDFSPGLVYTDLLEGHLLVEVKTTGAALNLVVQIANTAITTKYKYYYGDGTTDTGSTAGVIVTKTYAANSKFTALLFWDQAHQLFLNNSHQIIQTIEGKLPLKTLRFNCSGNQLTQVKNNIFEKMGAYASNTAIVLSSNALNSYALDDLIRFTYDARLQFNGAAVVNLQTQSPATAPTVDAGLSYLRTLITAAGITLTT